MMGKQTNDNEECVDTKRQVHRLAVSDSYALTPVAEELDPLSTPGVEEYGASD